MIATLCLASALTAMSPTPEIDIVPWLDFRAPERARAWRPVHDRVMGGVSDGRAVVSDETVEGAVRFEGYVSLDNNGGFASFRLGVENPELASSHGLRLRVRGDGQVYKLSLRSDGRWDGVSWQAPFATTAGAWTEIDVAFAELIPTWRGRLVADAPPFEPGKVRELGILIADKQEGEFALELASIAAWNAQGDTEQPGTRSAACARTETLSEMLDASADTGDLVDALRWSERLLVIAAPDTLDARSSIQMGRCLALRDELAARDMRIVFLTGSRGRLAGRTLDAQHTDDLRSRWELPRNTWGVALVGKDGEVKSRWSEPVEAAEVFAEIDGMSMRARELRERANGPQGS